mmetsp:Transcript_13716/g.37507  ORF Transcript_13716/g.37507 Transcript_13716/m.37507 type:complete len:575 (-) Transcript_13716:183-1907(-)
MLCPRPPPAPVERATEFLASLDLQRDDSLGPYDTAAALLARAAHHEARTSRGSLEMSSESGATDVRRPSLDSMSTGVRDTAESTDFDWESARVMKAVDPLAQRAWSHELLFSDSEDQELELSRTLTWPYDNFTSVDAMQSSQPSKAEDDRVEGSARFQHRPEAHSIASPESSPKSGRTDLGNSSCWSFGNLEESPRAQPQVVESHLADLGSVCSEWPLKSMQHAFSQMQLSIDRSLAALMQRLESESRQQRSTLDALSADVGIQREAVVDLRRRDEILDEKVKELMASIADRAEVCEIRREEALQLLLSRAPQWQKPLELALERLGRGQVDSNPVLVSLPTQDLQDLSSARSVAMNPLQLPFNPSPQDTDTFFGGLVRRVEAIELSLQEVRTDTRETNTQFQDDAFSDQDPVHRLGHGHGEGVLHLSDDPVDCALTNLVDRKSCPPRSLIGRAAWADTMEEVEKKLATVDSAMEACLGSLDLHCFSDTSIDLKHVPESFEALQARAESKCREMLRQESTDSLADPTEAGSTTSEDVHEMRVPMEGLAKRARATAIFAEVGAERMCDFLADQFLF